MGYSNLTGLGVYFRKPKGGWEMSSVFFNSLRLHGARISSQAASLAMRGTGSAVNVTTLVGILNMVTASSRFIRDTTEFLFIIFLVLDLVKGRFLKKEIKETPGQTLGYLKLGKSKLREFERSLVVTFYQAGIMEFERIAELVSSITGISLSALSVAQYIRHYLRTPEHRTIRSTSLRDQVRIRSSIAS